VDTEKVLSARQWRRRGCFRRLRERRILGALRLRRVVRACVRYAWARRVEAIGVAAVVLVASLSAKWLDDKEAWAAMGQWGGAMGSVLAVTVALRISRRGAESEAERRRSEKADEELAQARLVVGVVEFGARERTTEGLIVAWDRVRINNYGASHVFHPRVEGFIHQNGGLVGWDVHTVGWWDSPDDAEAAMYPEAPTLLEPNQSDVVPVVLVHLPSVEHSDLPVRTKVVIGFTDADGRRWRRIGERTPERVYTNDTFLVEGPEWYRAER
jgi:hypothetical protein